jgi:predicted DNA-binding protein (MmcQ/YjbR family)
MGADAFHERLLAIVKKLPEAEEDWPWGSIHCKVRGKIFVGWGRHDDGIMSVGLRTTPDLQSMLVRSDPRFTIAKYSGKYGGIDMRLGKKPNWAEVEQFIVESYRLVAPKRLVQALDEQLSGRSSVSKTASRPSQPKKSSKAAASKRRTRTTARR